MQKTTRPRSFDDMPACLKAEDVAAALGISRAHAYNLVKSEGFPRILVGQRYVIPKDAFMGWLERNTVTSSDRLA